MAHLFGFPIDAAVAIVQRDPHGMPAVVRDRALRQAIAVDRRLSGQSDGQLAPAAAALARAGHPDAARILSGPVSPGPPGGIPGLAGAFPLPNAAGLLRGAPLATLACAATAYVIAIRVVVWLAGRMGVTLPPDLDPVLVVLLLGVTTDYTVFFLDGMRAQVAGGVPRIRAARLATAEFAPIILAAGIIVAAAAASLVVARTKMLGAASFAMLAVIPLEQFRQIALAMALGVVLDAIAVRSLLVPALVALFGRLGMWPGNRRARPEPVPAAPPPVPAGDQP